MFDILIDSPSLQLPHTLQPDTQMDETTTYPPVLSRILILLILNCKWNNVRGKMIHPPSLNYMYKNLRINFISTNESLRKM